MVVKHCLICNKEFKTYPSKIKIGRGKYCSSQCSLKITSVKSNKTRWQKGQVPWNFKGWRYCGRGRKYIEIYKPKHPLVGKSGYIRKHRLIMEDHIGRYLTRDEEIHHGDGNGLNNNIDNLVIISKSKHLELEHSLGTYKKHLEKLHEL